MTSTTSLKLPDDVKERAIAAAQHQGVTPHAFMVDAIRLAAIAAEKKAEFVSQAQSARRESVQTGKGYPAADVHSYLRLRAKGKSAPKPKAKSWQS
ncbi:MAG TPA: CopG family transcriptional regulator [Solimonas sp.]|nr:CopG family transcriptional regulator [Solimonas sp.]